MIDTVTLLGGAINFQGPEKINKWRQIFSTTVSTSTANVYSGHDYVLHAYSFTHGGKQAAGRSQLPYEKERRAVDGNLAVYNGEEVVEFLNRDITLIGEVQDDGKVEEVQTGHLDYKNLTDKIFTMVSQY